jgi:predicted nucleic acid-binding protein
MVLEAAIAGEVGYIVTGDQDLLTLGLYEGIEIVTPARFLEILEHRGTDRP